MVARAARTLAAGAHWLRRSPPRRGLRRSLAREDTAAGVALSGSGSSRIGGQRYGARPDVFPDACRLPFKDERFTAVAAFDVLEHLPEPHAALREFQRLLAEGGWLLLSIPFLYPRA